MKLLDALQLKGGRIEIPDCTRSDLPQFFADMGYKVGVEIGVENGYFSEELLKAGLKLYSIDPWIHCPAWSYQRSPEKMEQIYHDAVKRLSKYTNSTIFRETSMDALKHFEKESIDFVYIDGNHEFRYVAEDIDEWSKKVRKGGIVSGHDYFTTAGPKEICTVPAIVHAYVGWFKIDTWYVLGRRRKRHPEEQRERHRSFFWIKQ